MGYFKTVPLEVEEAAWLDGCSRVGGLYRIVLPVSRPGVAISAVFAFSLAMQEYPNAIGQASAAVTAKGAICTNCHGANGVATDRSWPDLTGQSKEYLVNSLKAYKDGTRTNVVMSALAKDLSDADMDNLAGYYANASCK